MKEHEYVIINYDKVPQHSLNTTYKYEDVETEDNLAILVKEPYVILDVDDENYFNLLWEIIKDKNIHTRVMKTDRGGHFWFRSFKPLANNVNTNTPLTIKLDVKSWGKKSLVTVKRKGAWREWLQYNEDVDEIPFWLRPIKINKDLYDLKEGDGRDPQLFSYIIPLLNEKFTKSEIHEIFYMINKYVFSDSLKDEEIDKMFDGNDVFTKVLDVKFFNGSKFLHNVFADYLLETYNFRVYHNVLYVYDEGIYVNSPDKINKIMLTKLPQLRKNQLFEVFENLRLRAPQANESINPMIINVNNGLYDLSKHKFIEHTPEIFTVNRINCDYNPSVTCGDVDYMFDSVTMHDKELQTLLKEMVGYTLIRDCRFQKAFILLGQGANGKSKFIEMIMSMLGHENYSTLALEDLSERFRTAQMVDKMVNFGDDSGADLLKNTAIFKKLVTGDPMTVEHKHAQPFTFNNTAKLIFSANNLPPSCDKSLGFFRRMIIIPFTAHFKPGDKDYDPEIDRKLRTEEARTYLLNIGIQYAEKLIKNKEFTIPRVVTDMLKAYEMSNNTVMQWLSAGDRKVNGQTIQTIYAEYCLYCSGTNTLPIKMIKFNSELTKLKPNYFIETYETIDGELKQIWRDIKKRD